MLTNPCMLIYITGIFITLTIGVIVFYNEIVFLQFETDRLGGPYGGQILPLETLVFVFSINMEVKFHGYL